MSQENVELFRRAVDAFNRRDLDAFLAGADDDVEVFSFLVPMEGGFHGHDGIRRWWEGLLDVWPDYNVEVVDVRDLGDRSELCAVAATPRVATYRWTKRCGR